ncbi:MAG: hypothetical protein ABSF45_13190 [Terriglobia bacterium]
MSWTHLRQIIYLQDLLQRELYTQMCGVERWSTTSVGWKSTNGNLGKSLHSI